MRLLQFTLGAAATPILLKGVQPANSLPFQGIIIQNNSAAACRVGDSTVSATKGIYLAAGPGGGSITLQPALEYTSDVYEFYAFGTAGSVIDVLIMD
jgi:hypothetical protein